MRPHFVSLLCCPICKSGVTAHGFRASAPESDCIEQGLLVCDGCALPYPIIDGIPRMLPYPLEHHHNFVREFRRELAVISYCRPANRDSRSFQRLHALTARAFGYEWNTYKTTSQHEDFLTFYWLTGADPMLYEKVPVTDVFTYYPSSDEVSQINPTQLAGKRVLDVGCGMGKYLKVVSEAAAEVIGLDLSHSLQRARLETRDCANVHLVQGNILNPPLRRGTMDFVYSVGVLHHTPDCHRAFLRSASLVAPGGALAVWLYPADPTPGSYAEWVHWIQDDLLRPVTCRLPPWMLRIVCSGLGRLTFIRDKYADRFQATGSRFARRVAMAAGALAVGRHHDAEIAAFLNFDWYSPQYRSYHTEEELRGWYREAGFPDMRILPQRVSGIGQNPAAAASLG